MPRSSSRIQRLQPDSTVKTQTRGASADTPAFVVRPVVMAVHLAVATAMLGAGVFTSPAHAQTASPGIAATSAAATVRYYDIPAGTLPTVLTRFSTDAGIYLAGASDLAKGKDSPGLKGDFSVQDALSALLAGTGLQAVKLGNGGYGLREQPAVSSGPTVIGATTLPAITVTGTAANNEPPPPYAGGQVASGGRLGMLGNRDIMDTPFNMTSYTAETMANQQARSLSGVLNNDSSVRSVWSQGSYADEFFIRGFQVLNTDISWGGLYGVLPAQLIGPEYVERVEVLRGASALLNGIAPSGAIGGAINVVPKRATDDPITSVTANYASRAQLGTNVDIGRRLGDDNRWGIRFNGTFRDGDTASQDQSQRLGTAILGLDYRGDRFRASIDAGYQNQRYDGDFQPVWPASGFNIPQPPKATQNFFPSWTYSESRDTFGAAHAEYDVAPNWTVFGAVGGRDNQNRQLQAQPVLLNAAGDLDVGPDFFANSAKTTSAQLGLKGLFHTGPVKHQVSFVADYYRQESGYSLYYPDDVFSNMYHPVNNPRPQSGDYAFRTPTNAIAKNSSLAFADTLSILNDRVQLTVGIRQQRVVSDNYETTETDSGPLTSHYDKHASSPAIALVVKPTEQMSVYANFIEGLQQGPTAPSAAVNAGEVFAPYVSRQYEVGTKFDFGHFGATLSAFQIKQPNGLMNTDTMVYSVNGAQRNRGLELNVYGQASKRVRVLGGVTLMTSKLMNTGDPATEGNKAVGVPSTLVNIGAEWDTPFVPNLTLSGLMVYTSPQYVDSANTQKIPSWTRFDIGARYVIHRQDGQQITLRATVENLFNRAYWAGAAPNYGIALGSPRTFLLSAQMNF